MTNLDSSVSYDFSISDRMRSISTNAVQEARVAKGRGGLPFLDKDSRIQNMIEKLLHELTNAENVSMQHEHYPLVEKTQPLIGKKLEGMAELLDNLSEELSAKIEEPAVKANLPKAKQ